MIGLKLSQQRNPSHASHPEGPINIQISESKNCGTQYTIYIGFMIKVAREHVYNFVCTDNILSKIMLNFLLLTFLQITHSWQL